MNIRNLTKKTTLCATVIGLQLASSAAAQSREVTAPAQQGEQAQYRSKPVYWTTAPRDTVTRIRWR